MNKTTTELRAIDGDDLDRISGGQNTRSAEGNIGIKYGDANIGISGKASESKTDYASCLGLMAGQPPKAIVETCGKPGQK